MTAYVSASAGLWSSAATWLPAGVPGDGDTAALLHAVEIDVSLTTGTSAPGFTGTGLGDFAILVNGPQGAACASGNPAALTSSRSPPASPLRIAATSCATPDPSP